MKVRSNLGRASGEIHSGALSHPNADAGSDRRRGVTVWLVGLVGVDVAAADLVCRPRV